MAYDVTTLDGTVERIEEADSYALEGPLTTFFVSGNASGRMSAWSLRIASYRTDRIQSVHRVAPEAPVLRAAV